MNKSGQSNLTSGYIAAAYGRYSLQWGALFSLKIKLPLPIGRSGRPSNTRFPGPTQVLNPNGMLIGSAVFAGLTTVTNPQTDRPCYSVCPI